MNPRIAVDRDRLADFCRKWQVTELSLFGSVLRESFGPDSDVDVLISFDPQAHPSWSDLLQMQEQLEALFGRKVDLLTRRSIEASENYIRRKAILSSAQLLYAG